MGTGDREPSNTARRVTEDLTRVSFSDSSLNVVKHQSLVQHMSALSWGCSQARRLESQIENEGGGVQHSWVGWCGTGL